MTALVHPAPCLSSATCEDVVRRLRLAEDHWTPRSPGFHTLGTSAYLDARPDQSIYFSRAAVSDPVLWAEFGDVLSATCRAIETATGTPARLAPPLASPGFHIFAGDAIRVAAESAPPHFDVQHRWVPVPGDAKSTLSFTLPIALPRAGAGLDLWFVEIEAAARQGQFDLQSTPFVHHDYRLGELAIHTGHWLHRLAHRPSEPDDYRITLQGHAVLHEGAWHLYW